MRPVPRDIMRAVPQEIMRPELVEGHTDSERRAGWLRDDGAADSDDAR